MSALLITDARLVLPDASEPVAGDLLIADGHIAAIASQGRPFGSIPDGAERFDAAGALIAPGIIDIGVFAIDGPAFHAGGITRAALMPDGPPPLDDPGLIERAAKAGKPDLWIHPMAAATRSLAGIELAEIGLMQQAGARLVATGRSRIADSGVMSRLLSYAAGFGLATVVHCEDEGLTAGAVATESEMAMRLGLPAAPAEAEAMAIARDLHLVRITGASVHFRQVTTAAGFDLIRAAKAEGLPITCGVTPAHLFLSDVALGDWRTFAHLSPPLRQESDRQAALLAIADGTIDIIASGHDPRGPEDKRLPFADSAPGMAGAGTLLALASGLVRDGLVTLPRLFAMLSAHPARLLGIDAGVIAPGAEADLIQCDLDRPWQISSADLAGRGGNTPFDGLPVQGCVTAVWKGGRRVR